MARADTSDREEDDQDIREEEDDDDQDGLSESDGDLGEEEPPAKPDAKRGNKKKPREKKRKEELKSKATGLGLKISLDQNPAPGSNNKIVFDDTNLPTGDDSTGESVHSASEERRKDSNKDDGNDDDDDDDDDDAVEEVQGKAARDEALDQMKTEAQQSLKSKKKRMRKARVEKTEAPSPQKAGDDESGDGDDDMDEEFFAQLESAREAESEKKKELLDKSAARAKGRHTTFVFERNEGDARAVSEPVEIDESIQVVVLKNPSTGTSSFMTDTAISKRALVYSRNNIEDGSDRMAGEAEMKRKRNRSGEETQPWRRARPRLAMGRSRLKKGKPAGSFTRRRR